VHVVLNSFDNNNIIIIAKWVYFKTLYMIVLCMLLLVKFTYVTYRFRQKIVGIISVNVHSPSVARLTILIIDLLVVIKRYLLLLTADCSIM